MAHAVAFLKNYVPDLDLKLLRKEYQCKDDDERDALTEGVFHAAQHFVSQYDLFVASDQNSPKAQP
jgi:hypothetical protein